MTGDEFYKYHWKAMEVVEFVDYDGKIVQCAILGINFDSHCMKVVPVANLGYEEKEFWCAVGRLRKIVKNQKLTITKA